MSTQNSLSSNPVASSSSSHAPARQGQGPLSQPGVPLPNANGYTQGQGQQGQPTSATQPPAGATSSSSVARPANGPTNGPLPPPPPQNGQPRFGQQIYPQPRQLSPREIQLVDEAKQ